MSEYKACAEVGHVYFSFPPGSRGPHEVHLIAKAEYGESPSGTETTDYTAKCGDLAFEYSSGPALTTVFCETLVQAVAKGAIPCPKCFANMFGDSCFEPSDILHESFYCEDCPECKGHLTALVRYQVQRGGAGCDTSEWKTICMGSLPSGEPCTFRKELRGPNTSDFC